jgi:uncharacterized protein YjbI with pentapeptide repeats
MQASHSPQRLAGVHNVLLDESASWRDYWRSHGQPWRSEPEIDALRQAALENCPTVADIEQGRYPFNFKDFDSPLSRADIEWLLARQRSAEEGSGEGLDLRGADLRRLHLQGLPLAAMRGGLSGDEWLLASDEQREMAAVRLEKADLRGAHLEGAILCGAHLEEADLRGAHLEGADLRGAHLASANLNSAHLEGADLREAHLEGKESAPKPADLRTAFLSETTQLAGIILGSEKYGLAPVADVHWNNVNLAAVDWSQVSRLGDEHATQWKLPGEYLAAIRANRQLAAALRSQGLFEDANHFMYRAHVNQHRMLIQRPLLPVVLRVFVRERMPLPKVLLRLQERREGLRPAQHPVRLALLRLIPALLVLVLIALVQPLILLLILVAAIVATLAILPILRKRGRHPPEYGRSQQLLPPPGLQSQQQRRRHQWLILLGFLLGMPEDRLPLLLKSPQLALQQVPLLQRLEVRRPALASALSALLILLLLFDDTVTGCGRIIISLFLYAVTGFGYKLMRCLAWYLVIVLGCAALYLALGHQQPLAALAFSLASFHGRAFFTGVFSGSPAAVLAGIESIVGLIIEVTFIGSCLQRFSGR